MAETGRSADSYKLQFIASYPKSGNTYVRLLLQAYIHGQVDINSLAQTVPGDSGKHLYRKALPFDVETVPADVLIGSRFGALAWAVHNASQIGSRLVKSHWGRFTGSTPNFHPALVEKVVYLYRHPYEVVASYAKHLGKDIDETLFSMTEENRVIGYPGNPVLGASFTGSWVQHIVGHARSLDRVPTMFLPFDGIKRHPARSLHEIVQFLGIGEGAVDVEEAAELAQIENVMAQEREHGFAERGASEAFFTTGTKPVLSPHQYSIIDKELSKLPRELRSLF